MQPTTIISHHHHHQPSTRAIMESTRKEVTPFACGSVCVGALELADELLEVEHLLFQHGGLVSRHGPLLQKEVLCRNATQPRISHLSQMYNEIGSDGDLMGKELYVVARGR
jgi:hypothetical protein